MDIVYQLTALQQTRETIFGDGADGDARPDQRPRASLLNPTQSMVQCRRRVADSYERTKTRPSSRIAERPHTHYQVACLAMLGGSESISEAPTLEASGLVTTVEDYMYASLWHALHLADVPPSPMTMVGGPDGGLRKVAEAVARLASLVKEWGPSYFEQDEGDTNGNASSYISASSAVASAAWGGGTAGSGMSGGLARVPRSGGWAYALPLLASQQYETALAYLAEAGGGLGLLQATHIGIAMNAWGMCLCDFALEEESNVQETLLPMLVASYSASLQGLDASAALRYLVLLSGKRKFVKEQFEDIAGRIEPDGSRSNGALDSFFTKKEVSSLLLDSANHAIRVGKPTDAAELLVLSGRFGALFSFWFNAASQFHAIHLAHGRTYVQNTLDAEGNISLGNTFQLLMNLVVFFDRCRENQWEGAWVLMDDLQLIPKTESEMTVKVEAFRALDNCVRQVFHHVVLAAMEALCHLFQTLKLSSAGVSTDRLNAVDQSLNELRTRARLLVTFARLLNLPSLGDYDTHSRISQLERNMM
ncbi:hypothetical protein ACHAW5_006662 [Stephanodiscus triporus]|uniref:Nuclear pore protein n=1 Tax=Stephanodiscus triporus TaxID=2934178 RepID=A0ABD3N5C5_9STRA